MFGKSDKSGDTRKRRFSIIGLTMIVVIIPFCLYYLFFVISQQAYFSNRNLRVLAEISDHISSKMDNLAANLLNLSEKTRQDKSNKTKVEGEAVGAAKIQDRKVAKPASTVKAPIKEQDDTQKVKEAANLVRDFKLDEAQYQKVQMARPQTTKTTIMAAAPGRSTDSPAGSAAAGASPQNSNRPKGSTAIRAREQARPESSAAGPLSQQNVTMSVRPEKN